MWRELRKRPRGLKFRRQHAAGLYVVDFFCHQARLIIEIDGSSHDMGHRPARDAVRDRWFRSNRFQVMRIRATDVLDNLEDVIDGILNEANRLAARATPLRRPFGPPPPLKGEDQNG